ncbi:hypothetical protein [Phenylobacterium sp.]|jgi:hypothetical protein|uniref:hypothetical protein n=1 Tax=Phenylobacterium sp. TaxID=1871053 RepID=UPI002E319C31|nr:hypothetical protein [Phenylobacterium sp.]HEX2558818.1 hypothetical protein [Phenylobacterium sp.]
MRISWLIPLAALALAGCQAREPQAPGRPGGQAAAPPAATAPVPPPTLEPAPQTAAGLACPPAKVQAACPPAAKASARRQKARTVRHTGAVAQRVVQRRDRGGYERRPVVVPPGGGYRYEDLEDREIERRYAERRYEGERYGRREGHETDGGYRHEDHRHPEDGYLDVRPYRKPLPPPPRHDEERFADRESYRREDRYSGGHVERRGGYAQGGYERHEGYGERRPHKPEIRREHREARLHGGVRRYEERSYEESSSFRESYRESGSSHGVIARGGPCCVRPGLEAAGRDANGFLTWPGKVPAIP